MPFASDKQRRYLWSQKPEVARQIAYKNTGGWWNASTEASPMQIRNRQYNEYIRAGSPGKFKDWLAAGGGANVDTTQPSFQKSARDVARIATPYGSVEDAMSAGKNIAAGNYGQAAADAGLAAAGLIPFVRPAARAIKAAPLAKAALQGGEEGLDYAKLFAREAAGLPDRPARSVGASARFGEGTPKGVSRKVAGDEYVRRLGVDPSHPKAGDATRDIYYDVNETLAGRRVDPDSTIWRGAQPNPASRVDPASGKPLPDEGVYRWGLPTQEKWKELYGDLPYPTKDPTLMTAESIHGGGEKAISAIGGKQGDVINWKTGERSPVSAFMRENPGIPAGPISDAAAQGPYKYRGRGKAPGFAPPQKKAPTQIKESGTLPGFTPAGPKDDQFIGALRDRNVPVSEIARRLNVTESEAKKYIKAKGLNQGGKVDSLIKNPMAEQLRWYKPSKVKPKKGKGSYSRKKGPLAGGY